MKLIDVSCPGCGANLKVNDDKQYIVCEYCNRLFMIDDDVQKVEHSVSNAEQAGYDFEKVE